ncbi:MAG: hypothetical protein R3B60_01180 [Candidatus Paceibacterota bacterium]
MSYKHILIFAIFLLPATALGQATLVGIPGVSNPNTDLNTYINALYALSISVAALLAVIKIIVAGVKWMLTDVVTSKQDAKGDIWGATLGLLLIISAVLIFNTINPNITSTSLFIAPVSNPTNSAPTKAALPGNVTREVGDNVEYLDNNTEGQAECEDPDGLNGTWYGSNSSNADKGPCLVEAKKGLYRQETYNCVSSSAAQNGYDCSEGINKCTSLGGTWSYATSLNTGNIQYWRITCQ